MLFRSAEAIDERIADLNAIKAQSASLQYGLGSAFDQIPQERQEEMMAGGGMVAFAKGGDTFGTKFQESLTSLQDLAGQQPEPPTPEQREEGIAARVPLIEKRYGPDVTQQFAEEIKEKRAGLADQLEKDRGLAFAMASLKLLGRKAAPGESQQTQLIRGIGEAGDAFIGEVSRLKKENRDADDKLRQSEILLATAQQQRKEGKVKAAMDSEDKAEAKEQDAYKTKVGVREKTTQLLGGMAQAEMHDKTQKEVAAMQSAAHREAANKPGEMERMMSEVDAIRTGKKSFQGKTGEEGAKAYQDTLAQVGAARYGAKYTGPDKSIERSVQVQKALEQDGVAKEIGRAHV